MLKILKYIACLVLILFIADRVLYFAIDKIQQKTLTGESGGKINAYLKLPAPPSVLIMGPSSAAFQINPASFTVPAFNIGHAHTNDAFQAGLLAVIAQNKKLPKNILLHVTPSLYLGSDASAPYISDDPLKLKFFYLKNTTVHDYINELGIKEQVKFYMHLTCYNNRLINTFKNYITTVRNGPVPGGYEPLPPSDKDSFLVTTDYKLAQKGESPNMVLLPPGLVVQKARMRYLNDIVELCKKNNVNLVLFTLPDYMEVIEGPKNELATQNINAFCAGHHLRYFDFRKDTLSKLVNKAVYWKDLSHLNTTGADIESKFVAAEVAPFLVQ